MSRWFQIESLYKFNAKFCPVWVPRFFVFGGTKDAPRVAIAALEAEAFLVWPTLEVRRIMRRTARKIGLARLTRPFRRPRQRPQPVAASRPVTPPAAPRVRECDPVEADDDLPGHESLTE
jgi:hypothetical protein